MTRTTRKGFVNDNGQKVMGRAHVRPNHPSARPYHMECQHCDHDYVSNGCDIHIRKCPCCQGGQPGVDL